MNRKTLFIILVILVITGLVAGGVALWTRQHAGRSAGQTKPGSTDPTGLPDVAEDPAQTTKESETPDAPDILYSDLEPDESPVRDNEPAIRSVIIY